MTATTGKTSSGVQELLDRLRSEGLEAGRYEGERALSEARDEAKRVVDAAKKDAEATLAKAKEEIARFRRAGEEAIQLAARDALLAMKKQLGSLFERVAAESLRAPLRDPELAKKLALEIAAKALAADSPETEEERAALQFPKSADEALGGFVRANVEEMLAKGIELKADESFAGGVRAKLAGGKVRVDLDDRALAAFLVRRMAPQFRSIVEAALKPAGEKGADA